jgi:hypothetical protein
MDIDDITKNIEIIVVVFGGIIAICLIFLYLM